MSRCASDMGLLSAAASSETIALPAADLLASHHMTCWTKLSSGRRMALSRVSHMVLSSAFRKRPTWIPTGYQAHNPNERTPSRAKVAARNCQQRLAMAGFSIAQDRPRACVDDAQRTTQCHGIVHCDDRLVMRRSRPGNALALHLVKSTVIEDVLPARGLKNGMRHAAHVACHPRSASRSRVQAAHRKSRDCCHSCVNVPLT